MQNAIVRLLGILAATALFGCSSAPVASPTASTSSGTITQAAASPPAAPPTPGTATQGPRLPATPASLAPHLDPKSPLFTERSVYFDFDDFSIKSDYTAMIDRHGRYLASKPGLSIWIEGNADERGGSEYNLALGQKRAEAVMKALKIYGVKDSQMEATSWGSERPKATGHDEKAWAQNRRVDLVYSEK